MHLAFIIDHLGLLLVRWGVEIAAWLGLGAPSLRHALVIGLQVLPQRRGDEPEVFQALGKSLTVQTHSVSRQRLICLVSVQIHKSWILRMRLLLPLIIFVDPRCE